MLGGLGSALGPLAAGIVIGVSEAVTMAFASPSWAPIVSFSLLIALLLLRPGRPEDRPHARRDRGRGVQASPRFRSCICPRSTNRSSTSCCTGSCWPRRGTSCRAIPAISRSAMARSSAPACIRPRCSPASYDVPFLWTLPAAALLAALLGLALGAVVFRVRRVRGEVFALLTLAVTFVLGDDRAQHADRWRPRRLPLRGAVFRHSRPRSPARST